MMFISSSFSAFSLVAEYSRFTSNWPIYLHICFHIYWSNHVNDETRWFGSTTVSEGHRRSSKTNQQHHVLWTCPPQKRCKAEIPFDLVTYIIFATSLTSKKTNDTPNQLPPGILSSFCTRSRRCPERPLAWHTGQYLGSMSLVIIDHLGKSQMVDIYMSYCPKEFPWSNQFKSGPSTVYINKLNKGEGKFFKFFF